MDPSLPPPPFTAFPPLINSNSNSNPFPPPQHPFSSAVAQANNNQFFQPSPPVPCHPSVNHPHYSEMICSAISALNEPDGSSKQAISRYIERFYTGIPPAHGSLLTHHLRTLKNSGVLVMVKKSYKLAAAALEPPRSGFNETQQLPDPAATSAPQTQTQTQKRGRGRPPKSKPTLEQNQLVVSEQMQAQPPPVKRPPGRPRKDGALPTVKASVPGGEEITKRRGRPPSGRAAGRERKPAVVSAPVSVFPYVANGGVRRRGRPKRTDAGASSVAPPPKAEGGGEQVAKRGRGRPPKIGGVIRKAMKPKRGYFRTGRPRKNAASKGASGQQDISFGELKKKFELFQEKAKEIVNVLKAEVGGSDNQAVVQAIHDLEELTVTKRETAEEPRYMEDVQPDELYFENEPQPDGHGQGQVKQTRFLMAKTARTPSASHGTGPEAPRSDAAGSPAATDSQKRGRGRPPKSKSDSQDGAVSAAQPARKPSGRPKRNLATAAVATAPAAAGRPRRSNTVRATEPQVTAGDGSRKRGRPKKDDVAAPAKKQRGRKPKSEPVAKKTVGRPKNGASDPRELKKKAALLQKKVKQAADKLKIAVSAIEEVQEIAAGM
uniref:H15 domain-containing protein n=1 Tax=Brassica campestris TaxID=3711 RepID=M4ETX6_BRACM